MGVCRARNRFVVGTICSMMVLSLVLAASPWALAAGGSAVQVSGDQEAYRVTTQDGVSLALRRYRPGPGAGFEGDRQPVILMPGMLGNFNYFDISRPPGESYCVELPDPLPGWAQTDDYIKQDPMKYYSMAHFLWIHGYDVWLANYRGEGRAPYRSEGATGYSIDDVGIYDMPAIISKVYKVTGKHPVWIGHSMGSTMAYIYLEGARYGEGKNPHVVSDLTLVAERNGGDGDQSLKGFVNMDGPMIPMGGSLPDLSIVWLALYAPWYIELRPLLTTVGEYGAPVVGLANTVSWYIYKSLGMPNLSLLNTLYTINASNMDGEVLKYGAEYCLDGVSTRALAQYADAVAHKKFREDYLNGGLSLMRWRAADPRSGDGYFYYTDNLGLISLPALVLADSTEDITSPEDIENFYRGKTATVFDEFFMVPNTAHIDLVMGLNGPTITFPTIADWLDELLKAGD